MRTVTKGVGTCLLSAFGRFSRKQTGILPKHTFAQLVRNCPGWSARICGGRVEIRRERCWGPSSSQRDYMSTHRIQGPPRRFARGLSVQYGHAGHNGRRIAFSHPRTAGAAATVDLS